MSMSKLGVGRSFTVLATVACLCVTFVPMALAQTPWVLVARKAAQRVQHMRTESERAGQPTHDFATVLLEAPADKVFATALEFVRRNQQVRLVMTDPATRRLQFARGDRVATMNVVEFGPEVSQLMIAGSAGPNEPPTASEVVTAVLRVCREMNKDCQVEP
jgi:hypothetical protein